MLYNLAGQRVRMLVDETLTAGIHEVVWDGRDLQGWPPASGVYLARFEAAGQVFSRPLLLLK